MLSAYPAAPAHDAVNLYLVNDIPFVGVAGVVGLALGLPGPFGLDNTEASGVLATYFAGDTVGTDLGVTMAHEVGHYLGLFHTSQTNSNASRIIGHDPIADTVECSTAHLAGGLLNCPDKDNLMFPYVAQTPTPPVSPRQQTVIHLNPVVR